MICVLVLEETHVWWIWWSWCRIQIWPNYCGRVFPYDAQPPQHVITVFVFVCCLWSRSLFNQRNMWNKVLKGFSPFPCSRVKTVCKKATKLMVSLSPADRLGRLSSVIVHCRGWCVCSDTWQVKLRRCAAGWSRIWIRWMGGISSILIISYIGFSL